MRIAIFTHYYLSNNYGGNLQAYALCKVLEDLGHEADQVCYLRNTNVKQSMIFRMKKRLKSSIKNATIILYDKNFFKNIDMRKRAICVFNQESIPHTNKVYDDTCISLLNEEYDFFITGSDQVWHPNVLCSGYLLEFCDSPSKKISYAASIATNKIDLQSENRLKKALSSFSHISTREQDSVSLLSEMGIRDCEWVLDPTLLLTSEEWRKTAQPFKIEKDYVLTYFLGDNEQSRQNALEYAKRNGLLLVSLPFLLNSYRKCDRGYGDIQLYAVSPEQLLYLIDHSKAVFTDSFHATVFSILLSTPFLFLKGIRWIR